MAMERTRRAGQKAMEVTYNETRRAVVETRKVGEKAVKRTVHETKKAWKAVKALGMSAISETIARLAPDKNRTFRLISRERSHKTNTERLGLSGARLKIAFADLFHTLLNMPWWKLFTLMTLTFIGTHLVYGTLMFLGVYQNCEAVTMICANEADWLMVWMRCLFLSVQAGQSIGFGLWAPVTHYLNVLVCFDAYIFVLFYAVLGGLVYAKLTRPSRMARCILFSKSACVNSRTYHYDAATDTYRVDGTPCLTLRFVSTRRHQMMTPVLRLYLLRLESEDGPNPPSIGPDGEPTSNPEWRIHDLDVDTCVMTGRMRGTTLPAPHTLLPITAVHVMDKDSPLYGATDASLVASHAEIMAVYECVDEACSCTLQARWSYLPSEVQWGCRFRQIITWDRVGEGKFHVDLSSFDDWESLDRDIPIPSAPTAPASPLQGPSASGGLAAAAAAAPPDLSSAAEGLVGAGIAAAAEVPDFAVFPGDDVRPQAQSFAIFPSVASGDAFAPQGGDRADAPLV
eukprot:m51a1_g10276 hypothetical protein (513) ;mRNA; f:63958-66131